MNLDSRKKTGVTGTAQSNSGSFFLNQLSGRVPYEITLPDHTVFMLAMIAAHDGCSISSLIETMVANRVKEIGLTPLFKEVKDISR